MLVCKLYLFAVGCTVLRDFWNWMKWHHCLLLHVLFTIHSNVGLGFGARLQNWHSAETLFFTHYDYCHLGMFSTFFMFIAVVCLRLSSAFAVNFMLMVQGLHLWIGLTIGFMYMV